METYTLRDGLTVPKVGFGTYKLNGAHGVQVIDSAIDRGYRLLDTAFNYEMKGPLVRRSGVLPCHVRIDYLFKVTGPAPRL